MAVEGLVLVAPRLPEIQNCVEWEEVVCWHAVEDQEQQLIAAVIGDGQVDPAPLSTTACLFALQLLHAKRNVLESNLSVISCAHPGSNELSTTYPVTHFFLPFHSIK